MTTSKLPIPEKLIPVFTGEADVRGSHGGRGSAKTRTFALMAAVYGYRYGKTGVKGQILCCRQFMNSLDDSSLEELKRAIDSVDYLAEYYDVGDKYIKSRDGNIYFTFAGLDRNIGSVKSKGRILLCWIDEAEPVTEYAFSILTPTLREEGEGWNAELWVTWNPERETAAVEQRYRNSKDPGVKIVEMNYSDNKKFPKKLERERLRDKEERPDDYDWIWEGKHRKHITGTYYAAHLTKARKDGRVGRVPIDPLMTVRLFVDIGGTGAKADAFTIWAAQFIGLEIRWLKYYESVGQPIDAHLRWCRENDFTPDVAQFWLPHDGATNDKVHKVSYESALEKAGYKVTVVPNQGKGAAMARIEEGRRLFPSMWFDEEGCKGGIDALGWYHEKRDEKRNIGLGPNHDWASHGADSFGLGCVVYEPPKTNNFFKKKLNYSDTGIV